MLDVALSSLHERFHQIKRFFLNKDFLFNLKNIPQKRNLLSTVQIYKLFIITHNSHNRLKIDIDGNMLIDELITFQTFLQGEVVTPVQGLNFIKQYNIQELYPFGLLYVYY